MYIYIAKFVGALALTFIMIRLANWCLRKVGQDRLGFAHVSVAVVASIAGAYGFADGGEPKFLVGAAIYAPASLVWLIVDLYRSHRNRL